MWLPEVAARGWVALSHNKKIARVPDQRDAAMRSGLALFLLIGKRHNDLRQNLIATVPRIITFREEHELPFIAKVHRPPANIPIGDEPGTVTMYLTLEAWRGRGVV